MESMSDQKNLDLINVAIHRLIEERKPGGHGDDPFLLPESDDDHHLLSKLLSQLESLKGELATNNLSKESSQVGTKDASSGESVVGAGTGENPEGRGEAEETIVIKELREVKKQNTMTHWLIGILIVLTVTWQVSEVSLMLKLKNGLSHPFRSLGGMLAGMLKGRSGNGKEDSGGDSGNSPILNQIESSLPIPPAKIPELLPKLDILDLGSRGDNKD